MIKVTTSWSLRKDRPIFYILAIYGVSILFFGFYNIDIYIHIRDMILVKYTCRYWMDRCIKTQNVVINVIAHTQTQKFSVCIIMSICLFI